MLRLAAAMRDRGNEVVFATADDARPQVEAARIEMVSAGTAMRARLEEFRARYPEAAELRGTELPPFMFPRMFGEITAPPIFDDLMPFASHWKPHAIVHDAADLASPIIGTALGIPHVTHSFGAVLPNTRVADAAIRTEPLWRGLGLEPRPYSGCYEHLYLDIYPPSMQPPADLAYLGRVEHLRPFSVDAAAHDELSPSIEAATSGDRPIVYVTFGTVFNATSTTFTAAVDALARCRDLRAIVTVGPEGDVDAFGALPEHVRVEPYVPQAALLPRCAAVVSHGGSGTLLASLAHGIPQLVLPQAADQFLNAQACAAAGAGLALMGEEATADAIEAALRQVLVDDGVRNRAARVQGEIAAMPAPDDVAAVIEAL